MRVISGIYRGTVLTTPKDGITRPTTDRVRESLFNILNSLQTTKKFPVWEKQHVLDGFCGSGALGIEALSRGAKTGLFIDRDKQAIKACKKNLESCNVSSDISIIKHIDLLSLKEKIDNKPQYTMIFLDPPYGKNLGIKALEILKQNNFLSDNAIIILETDKKHPEIIPDNINIIDERFYGRVRLQFLIYN